MSFTSCIRGMDHLTLSCPFERKQVVWGGYASPLLKVFKTQLDKTPSNLVWPQSWPCFEQEGRWETSWGPTWKILWIYEKQQSISESNALIRLLKPTACTWQLFKSKMQDLQHIHFIHYCPKILLANGWHRYLSCWHRLQAVISRQTLLC